MADQDLPLYPHVAVDLGHLDGADGNAYVILGRVTRALRRHVGNEAADAFRAEATAGDYQHLLEVTRRTVDAHVRRSIEYAPL